MGINIDADSTEREAAAGGSPDAPRGPQLSPDHIWKEALLCSPYLSSNH